MGGALPTLYCLWAVLSIGLALAAGGLSPENVTRLLVIAFLLAQLACRPSLTKALPRLAPRTRFVLLGTLLAAVVEGFHMISMPVFPSLRVNLGMSMGQGLTCYALDLLYTVPAYLAIFSVVWRFIQRYDYSLWQYILLMGLAQTTGDGGMLFFLNAPHLLLFLPYPATNYHAINIIPFLAVREDLPSKRLTGARAYLAFPAVVATYLICGAIIKLLGRHFGLESN